MRAEVIAIGDELTTGQRLDTNSQWLSVELGLLGIPVVFHTTACDTLEAGIDAFRTAAARCDVVVATGGLGPTADDLTRDVLAAVAGEPLELSTAALEAVTARFALRGVTMPDSNRRQAEFPRGSRIIPNPDGTAPGVDLTVRRPTGGSCRIFALPGVPSEMRSMWGGTVAAALLAMQPEAGVFVHRRLKCFGAGESAVEAMLPDLIRRGRDPLVGITAHEATITLRIVARGRDEAECLAKIAPTEELIRGRLGPIVYGVEDDEVEDAAVRALLAAGESLGTIEIGTEGRLAAWLAAAETRRRDRRDDGPGGGDAVRRGPAYRGGIVLPATAVGGPDPDAAAGLDALAERARADFGASIGVAVGPPYAVPEHRTAVTIALADGRAIQRSEHVLGGGPTLSLSRAAKAAMDAVRRRLETAIPAAPRVSTP